jgi:hypothetical protein
MVLSGSGVAGRGRGSERFVVIDVGMKETGVHWSGVGKCSSECRNDRYQQWGTHALHPFICKD